MRGGGSRRGVIGVGIVCLVLAAVSLTLAFAVAEGAARDHATFHLFVGLICVALFAAIGLLWKPRESTAGSMVRAGLLIVIAMGAFGQLLESIGASGYDRDNAGHEIELLTSLHNSVGIVGPVALIAVPLGVIAAVVLLIGLVLRYASARRAG